MEAPSRRRNGPGGPSRRRASRFFPPWSLSARGIDTPERPREFLAGGPERLEDPLLLRDMDRAVERIRRAVEQGELLAVYGDYDVDGITSTCLLTYSFCAAGADVVPYIPDRMEGWGDSSCAAVDTLHAQESP